MRELADRVDRFLSALSIGSGVGLIAFGAAATSGLFDRLAQEWWWVSLAGCVLLGSGLWGLWLATYRERG